VRVETQQRSARGPRDSDAALSPLARFRRSVSPGSRRPPSRRPARPSREGRRRAAG
jgi:hypothetical protein